MLGSPIIDLAIGMAFIYLLLSLIASVVQEMLATITQARAANLERGLHSLFSGDPLRLGPDGTPGTSFVDALYAHGLIRGLYQDPAHDQKDTASPKGSNAEQKGMQPAPGPNQKAPSKGMSYQTFQLALRRTLRKILGITPPGYKPRDNDLLLPAYIPARTFALALTDLLNDGTHGWDSLASIEAHLRELKARNDVAIQAAAANPSAPKKPSAYENKAVEALLALLIDAEGKADKFQTNLEDWYNDSMDRASGWYKRNVQRILLVIGLIIAIVFNVDSIRVARTLWFDHDARQGLADAATSYIQNHPNTAETPSTPANKSASSTGQGKDTPAAPAASSSSIPASSNPTTQTLADSTSQAPAAGSNSTKTTGSSASTGTDSGPTSKQFDPVELQSRLKQTVDTFNRVGQSTMLPVGWRHRFPGDYWTGVQQDPKLWWQLLLALVGWAITAGALSLGAPFWFDMLNKFMIVRSTVKPSEKSPNESSKS